jgi:hypothetical protein
MSNWPTISTRLYRVMRGKKPRKDAPKHERNLRHSSGKLAYLTTIEDAVRRIYENTLKKYENALEKESEKALRLVRLIAAGLLEL